MSRRTLGIGTFVTTLLIIGGGYLLYANGGGVKGVLNAAPNFSETGNLTKDAPGLNPDTWYLTYEKTGAPALHAELAFDQKSMCDGTLCNPSTLKQGARVSISGVLKDAKLTIRTLTTESAPTESGKSVSLFYYNPKNDTDQNGVMLCSEKGVVGVKRILPDSINVIADAIKLELRGELSAEEKAAGLTTEFPIPGLSLATSTLQNGTLTLTFKDLEHRTTGGSCRVTVLRSQIESTAKQFPEVKNVRIMPEDLFQP